MTQYRSRLTCRYPCRLSLPLPPNPSLPPPSHYGPERKKKHSTNSRLMIHFLTSSGLSERASQRVRAAEQSVRAARSKQINERCERTSERTSEWPSTSVFLVTLELSVPLLPPFPPLHLAPSFPLIPLPPLSLPLMPIGGAFVFAPI